MTDQNSAVLFSDDQTLKHAPIIASRSARHSFFLQACGDPKGPIAAVSRLPPVSGSFQQLRDGVLPCRCHGVSRFEGPHCPPLCCPRVCLNGAFDVQSRVSQRPRPGPEQRSAGHGSHTWQAVSETRMSVVDESRVPFLTSEAAQGPVCRGLQSICGQYLYITLQFHCMEKSSSEILPATQHRVNMFFSAELYKSKVRLLNSNLSMLGVVLYGPLELACVCIVGLVTTSLCSPHTHTHSQTACSPWSCQSPTQKAVPLTVKCRAGPQHYDIINSTLNHIRI
ncbi:hypothetical protein ROHU_036222 [Labeo rohita]|uniref:Uncharacterized protein n=1 Tax=Labeo rohita TaxID=84645 RepID=A0A498NFV9_LABRO|nr:hypothetical protein ROHU_036222 [Labeo rohita]